VSDEVADKAAALAALKGQLARVPNSVRDGSHQHAVAFKKFHASASKTIAGGRASLLVLNVLAGRAKSFYGP